MNWLNLRPPRLEDLGEAMVTLMSMRGAPPLVMSVSTLVIITGSLIVSVIAGLVSGYIHALWSLLCQERPSE